MRVTLFHLSFPEYVMGLANNLAAYADVTVIHPESLAATCRDLADPRVNVVSYSRPRSRVHPGNLAAMGRALRLIRESAPDILHVQETFDYAYDLYSSFVRLPSLVTTIHDVVPHPGDGHAAPGLQYTKAVGCWRSARLVVHTEGMRNQLASRFRISSDRIDVIPHGELGSLYQRLASVRGRSPAEREPYTMLFFGRIWPYKGLRYLLEAFAIVKQQVPEARLLICGKGGDLDTYSSLIASQSGIEVHGSFIPGEEVAGLFERSSVVVLPYIEASQSGVSAIGFTTGAVVVASRVGGLAELIVDRETGILVTPRDSTELASALTSLLLNPLEQQRIRKAALSFGSSNLEWSMIAQRTMGTYERALASSRL